MTEYFLHAQSTCPDCENVPINAREIIGADFVCERCKDTGVIVFHVDVYVDPATGIVSVPVR